MFLQLEQAFYGRTSRIPQEETFHFGEFLCVNCSVFIGYFCKSVDDTEINVFGKNVFAYSFGYVGVDFILVENPGLMVFFKNAAVGINTPNLNVRILFL